MNESPVYFKAQGFANLGKSIEEVTKSMNELAEKMEEIKDEKSEEKKVEKEKKELDPNACKTHQKRPGHFWSSCAACHKTRMAHEKKRRAEGKPTEDRIHEARADAVEGAEA